MTTSITNFEKYLAAGEIWRINVMGTIIRGMRGVDTYTVRPELQNPLKGFETGIGVTFPDQFKIVEIINRSTAQTVGVYIGDGLISDSRSGGTVTVGSNPTASYGAVTVTNAATLVKGALSTRGKFMVQNLGGVAIYLGTDNSVSTLNGVKIQSGGSMEISFQDAVYCISSGIDCDVRYIEESTA